MKLSIFCNVIDNYGDIGIAWRLARQLLADHAANVTLWVDDLDSFARIAPGVSPSKAQQSHLGIRIHHWPAENFPAVDADEVIIEAFGCRLPESYEQAMSERSQKPVWINLEYLSAEDWVSGCHGLASPHPNLPLKKYFFFPGFGEQTGGLICESSLIAEREAWQADHAMQDAYWHSLGVPARIEGEQRISVFCYESASIRSWLPLLMQGPALTRLLIPQGKILPDIAAAFGRDALPQADDVLQQGQLIAHILPLTDQDGYDRLLWSCDLNIVRGEDSFVRAQWAARPFIWHIYRQEDDAHIVKLNAFLQHYTNGLSDSQDTAICQLWQGFNRDEDVCSTWQNSERIRAEWLAHAQGWPQKQLRGGDLATRLVHFIKKQIQ